MAGGLGDGDGVGGATKEERGDAGGGLPSADIGCSLSRCSGSREVSKGEDMKKVHPVKRDVSQRPTLTKRGFLTYNPQFRRRFPR